MTLEAPSGEVVASRTVPDKRHTDRHVDMTVETVDLFVEFPTNTANVRLRREDVETEINPITSVLRDVIDRIPEEGFAGDPEEVRSDADDYIDDVAAAMEKKAFSDAKTVLEEDFVAIARENVRAEYDAYTGQPTSEVVVDYTQRMIDRLEVLAGDGAGDGEIRVGEAPAWTDWIPEPSALPSFADSRGFYQYDVASILESGGIVARREGNFEAARRHFERCLELSRALGDRRQAASTLNNLGIVAAMGSDYDRARDCFERTLEIKRTLGDRQGVTDTLNNLGLVAEKQGAYDRAREYLERALEEQVELDNRSGEADACNNLGEVARLLGEYDRARDLHRRSLDINQEIGQRQGEAQSLGNLGVVARLQDRYDSAREYHRQSLEINRELDDRPGEATAYHNLGMVALRGEAYDQAQEHFERALDVATDVGLERVAVESLTGLGEVAIGQGEHERAKEHLEDAEDRIGDDESPIVRVRLEKTRGRLALARDRLDRARELIERTRELSEGMGAVHETARSRRLLGRVATRAGGSGTAREYFEAALATFEDVEAPEEALATVELLTEVVSERSDEDAQHLCRRARELLDGAPEGVVRRHREWVDRYCDDLALE